MTRVKYKDANSLKEHSADIGCELFFLGGWGWGWGKKSTRDLNDVKERTRLYNTEVWPVNILCGVA